jgi:O-antigen/teichoic acid export membrane protein
VSRAPTIRGNVANMSLSLTSKTSVFLAAQLVTSATNFVVSLALARALSPRSFGQVAVVLTVIFFFVSFQRSVFGDTLLLFAQSREGLVSMALAVCLWLAGTVSLLIGFAWLAFPHRVAGYLVGAAGVLLLQDGLRYLAVAVHRSSLVLTSDLSWFAAGLAALSLSLAGQDIQIVMSVWLAGGLVAIVVLAPLVITLADGVKPSKVVDFYRSTQDLTSWLAVQYLLTAGAIQFGLVGMAAFIGAADFGGYRAVQLLVAPVLALALASVSPMMSWSARRGTEFWTSRRLNSTSAGLAALAVLPCLPILVLSHWLLVTFLGRAYGGYAGLSIPAVLGVIAVAGAIPSSIVLRQFGAGKRILWAAAIGSLPGVALTLIASWRFGVYMAAWAFVAQYVAVCIASLVLAGRTLKEHIPAPRDALGPPHGSF